MVRPTHHHLYLHSHALFIRETLWFTNKNLFLHPTTVVGAFWIIAPPSFLLTFFFGLEVQRNKISIAFLFIAIPFLIACGIHAWKDALQGSRGAGNLLSKQNKNYSLTSFVIVWGLVAKTWLWYFIQPILGARFENQKRAINYLTPRLHPSFPNLSLNLAKKCLAAPMVCSKV